MDMGKISTFARTLIWSLPLTIVGLSGLFARHYYGSGEPSPVDTAMAGDYTHAFHQIAMNYTGMDTYQNTPNDLKTLGQRALVPKVAIGVGIMIGVAKGIYDFFKG